MEICKVSFINACPYVVMQRLFLLVVTVTQKIAALNRNQSYLYFYRYFSLLKVFGATQQYHLFQQVAFFLSFFFFLEHVNTSSELRIFCIEKYSGEIVKEKWLTFLVSLQPSLLLCHSLYTYAITRQPLNGSLRSPAFWSINTVY